MKIALVKQDVYPDLYITDSTDPLEILKSSMGRVGPIGLFTKLAADFYIVREEKSSECQFFRKVMKYHSEHSESFKNKLLNEISGQEFKEPGSPFPNSKFSIDVDSIDWGKYDIVISVNISLPRRILKKHPDTLFAYMIGEANKATFFPKFGYDVTLNQETHGREKSHIFSSIDFPYTFIGGDCLEQLLFRMLGRKSKQDGIYSEINMSRERPVSKVPKELREFEQAGFNIRLHKQNIINNLIEVYDSKYFIKVGGRVIRGNSVIEAISCNTLVLALQDSIIHKNLIPNECYFSDINELKDKLKFLESDEDHYNRLLDSQKKIVEKYCFNSPYISLKSCLKNKRMLKDRYIETKRLKLTQCLISYVFWLKNLFRRALKKFI